MLEGENRDLSLVWRFPAWGKRLRRSVSFTLVLSDALINWLYCA